MRSNEQQQITAMQQLTARVRGQSALGNGHSALGSAALSSGN